MASLAFAQVAGYTFAYSAGSYTEITGGTVLGTATAGGSGATSLDNVMYPNVPLPFQFAFNGRKYSQVSVNSNGYLVFNGTTSISESTPLSTTATCDGVVSAYGKDNQGIVTAGSLGEISYETLGSAPTRTFVIQWKNFRDYSASGDLLNFQIQLCETKEIKFVYGSITIVNTDACQVGLRGTATSDFNNRTSTTSWTATTAGTANTATISVSTSINPGLGTTFTFTPPAPTAIPNVATVVSPLDAATNVFATATLNWADGGGWTNGFKLYFGTTTPPPLVGDLGYVTSYDPPGDMNYTTPYYWKVVPYNGFGDQTTGSIWSFTTAGAPLTGTKTIGPGGNYISFTEAINALNGSGVGTGGVTFNVADGTYNESPPAITISGSASNPIVFQSLGGNTVVTPAGGAGTFAFKLMDADYITFDNIDITGPNTLVYGYWLAGGTAGAQNNTIKNCTITIPYSSTSNYAIYSLGVTGGPNSNCTFQNNTIANSYYGIYASNSSTTGSEGQNTNFQGNTLTGMRYYAIYMSYCQNSTIQYNNVSFITAGTTGFYGIYTYGSSSTMNVHHNTISGGYTSGNVYGIYNYYPTATFDNNTVSNVYNTSSSTWYGFYDYYGSGTWTNNTISNITNTGTASLYGFYVNSAGTSTWSGNTLTGITITSGTLYAMYTGSATTTTFHHNIVSGLSGTGTIYGCYVSSGTTNHIYSNKIYNLTYTGSSTSIIYGIYVSSGTTNNIYNNMVYDIKSPAGTGTAPQIRAMVIAGGTTDNIWNNSIYLNSTSSNASFASALLYVSSSTAAIDLMNNILVNKSTPGTTGRNVAIWKTTAGVSNFSTTTDKNIYYCGEPDATHIIGYFNSVAYQTLVDYKTMAATKDQGSYTEDVPFVSATRVIDLHINPTVPTRVEGNAMPLAMVTQDIDNNPRSATPDIGADEGTFTAPQGVPGQVTLNSPANDAEGINPITGVLSWGAPTTGGTPTEYWVYVSTSLETIFSESFTVVALPATSLVLANVEGLTPDFSQTYYWAVQAHNSSGESDPEDPNFQIWSFTTCNQMSVASTLNLGNVWPSAPKTGTIPVQNLGTTQITFTASGSPEFVFGSTRFTVPASSTYNLPYTFNAPATTGAYTGSITLTQTLPIVMPQGITVSGNISTDVSVGDGTVNVYQPVYGYYGYTYSQTIYPAAWFSYPTGYRIERLQFYWNPALAPLNTSSFKVWMGHTTQEQFPASVTSASWIPLSQLTLVFDGTWNISAGAGWKELVLQTPFIYNRTDNLVIAFDENTSGYDTANTTSSFFQGTSTTGVYRGMSCYDDVDNFDPANPDAIAQINFTSYASRQGYPNTKFILGAVPVNPVISVNPETWDFGSVIVNTSNTKQFTIQNTGGGTLSISGITPASSGYFSLTGLPSFPVNLTSGQSTTFSVQYLPTAAGTHTATFTIADNRGTTPVVVNGVCVDPRITSLPHIQNFDTVTTPALPLGWTAYKGNAGQTLNTSTTYSQSSPNSVYMYNSSYTTVPLQLITPQITVPMNTIRLSFYARSGSAGYALKVGTINALDGTGTFTELASYTLTAGFVQYVLPLNSYLGADQYICFQHGQAASSQSIYIDNVMLELLTPNDLACTLLSGLTYGKVGTPITYTITVYNNGTATQNAYNIHLKRYGDDRLASLPVSTPLAPGASAQHTITWTPLVANVGTYQLQGEVELATDANSANNLSPTRLAGIYPATAYLPLVGDPQATTTANTLPTNVYWKNGVTETIYTAQEMQMSAGNIQGLVYYNSFTQDVSGIHLKIWAKNTTSTDLSSAWLPFTDYALVFDGTVDFPNGSNSIYIPFSAPVAYTGGNFAIRVNRVMDTVYYPSSNVFYYTVPQYVNNRSRYMQSDTTTYDPLDPGVGGTGTLLNNIPITTFIATDAVPVSLATPSVTITHSGTNVTLNWAAVPNAYGYRVYASDDPLTWPSTPLSVVYTNSYTGAAAAYKFFKVTAVSSYRNGESTMPSFPLQPVTPFRINPPAPLNDNKD